MKIGDKVIIISREKYNEVHQKIINKDWNDTMFTYCGKLAAIKSIIIDTDDVVYRLDIDNGDWIWYKWMITPIKEAPNTLGFITILTEKLNLNNEKLNHFLKKADLNDDEILEYLAVSNYHKELTEQLRDLEKFLIKNK